MKSFPKFSYWRHFFRPRDLRFLRLLLTDCWRPIASAPHRPEPQSWRSDAITGAWLGHATVLVDFFGVKILTDPVLAARCGLRIGPLLTIGPKRYVQPALKVSELPPIDVLLLTHAHMDHLDWWTLRRLPRGASGIHAITAKDTRDLLTGMPFSKITELRWDEATEIEFATPPGGKLRVQAFRVNHWGARMRHDTHRGYNGYLVERAARANGAEKLRRICFAGDTAFTDFSHVRISENDGGIDLMAVPIGAYNPWIMSHCTPEQAVQMAAQAGAKRLLPIHHSTFKLSAEPLGEPLERFRHALANEPQKIVATEIGETFSVA